MSLCLRLVSSTLLIILFSIPALAGLFELSAQGEYKRTNFDPSHSVESESGTVGLAYYFWGADALEIFYTRGDGDQTQPEYDAYQSTTAYGLDFLVTMANQDSALKPYLKVGAEYQVNSLRYLVNQNFPITINTQGMAPIGGMGFKLMLGKQFAIKAGVEVSTSPINIEPITYDFGVTGGISILF